MTVFLTVEDILEIHRQVIAATGGLDGLRDVGLLDAAVHRPQAGFGGVPFYPDLHEQAAALLHSLATNHPFGDGNKRTAFTAADVFLRLNGGRLTAGEDEKYDFMMKVAASRLSFQEITQWMGEHFKHS
jgi:death-on-curing protein